MTDSDANLIVNYLPNSFDENMLTQLFSKFGILESVKVVREKGSMKSMGYGFVKFNSPADAQRAIAGLSGQKFENKTLKVCVAVARPQGSNTKNTNLYVAGLEPHVTSEELQSFFQAYGKVTESKVLVDPVTKQSRCVGFARFETQEEADGAIAGLNGVTLPSATKPLIVRVAEERDRHNMSNSAMMAARAGNMRFNPMGMYGANMPQVGYQYPPAAYGQGYPTAPGFPPGYPSAGNMFGQQPFAAANPQAAVPGALGGPQRDLSNTICLFVYNLPPETDESYMYQLFGPYGAVANVKVMRDLATSLCKGYGFVNMSKLEDAQMAINALNGAQIGNKNLQVSFKQNKNGM